MSQLQNEFSDSQEADCCKASAVEALDDHQHVKDGDPTPLVEDVWFDNNTSDATSDDGTAPDATSDDDGDCTLEDPKRKVLLGQERTCKRRRKDCKCTLSKLEAKARPTLRETCRVVGLQSGGVTESGVKESGIC